MKLSPQWLRDFVDLTVDDARLAEDLTAAGIAVEGISGEGDRHRLRNGDHHQPPGRHESLRRRARGGRDLRPAPEAHCIPSCRKPSRAAAFPIEIAEPELCPRFTGRVLRNVQIKPSPANIIHRLGLLDQRSINNAVDATNYVLWEIGKPTHVSISICSKAERSSSAKPKPAKS